MKILLTGGNGFIGQNLIAYLISAGHEILVLGRNDVKIKDVHSIIIPEFTTQRIEQALSNYKFDAVINLAAAGIKPGDRDIGELLNINVLLPSSLVSIAAKCGAKAFISAGSSAEYQIVTNRELITEKFPLETNKLYGTSKASGGIMALATGINLGIPVAVTRLFNVYGSGEAPHRLLPSLISDLKQNKPVNLSPGLQIRDFIYVEDVCSGITATLNALLDGSLESGAYNISTGIGTTVADFCKTTARLMDANPDLLKFGALPLRPDDYEMVVGDSNIIQDKTVWKPNFSVEKGINKAIKSFSL